MKEDHGHDIASHCHEAGHFNSSVKHVCEMCDESLRAVIRRAGDVGAMEAFLDGDESRSMRELAEKFSAWLLKGG